MIVLCVFFLVDKGEFFFDDLVLKYWLEFVENGKVDVKVFYFMLYLVGFFIWEEDLDIVIFYDWEKVIGLFVK